ncbi:putative heme oxygenase [Janthinobacterium sp. HH01]|uniref:biliverdin-producing heme oxygenase n=1 Tax=Janthinobacterium sp. HH01 TaxID=1198452 RepID=UPI0002AEA653|nr:biliverdin-producing heme oxygenase [Janthinobacterium sp. HH01]ELX10543.1 putative heme oxygenase [Janthinobacterium sp. HH01]
MLDVLTALRQSTAQRHAELDTRTPLAGAAPDLRAYRDHLRLLEAWLAPIEAWLDGPADGALQAFARADYLRWIREDLADASLAQLPPARPLHAADGDDAAWPQDSDAAYRWGVCYVIEGSQLGGAVLYKRWSERLAPHPLRYLRGAGSPGPRWQQFLAALRGEVTSARQIDAACRGARQAFDRLIALNRALHR